jgi:hypothetical protein
MKSVGAFIATLLLLSPKVQASHLLGSDMSYKSLGGGKYKIICRAFRDCNGIALGSQIMSFGVYAGTGGGNSCGSTRVSCTRTSIVNISSYCGKGSIPCIPVNNALSGEGIEMHVFETIVDFNTSPLDTYANRSSCCEVTFYAGECCRSGIVTTGGGGSNFFNTCTINICNLKRCSNQNSSAPEMSNKPPRSICCNMPYYYNPGYIDSSERDSISYSLAPAISLLPLTYVSYNSPHSYRYPLTPYCTNSKVNCQPEPYLKIPQGLFLDSTNGDLIFTPTKCDEGGIVCIEATEWRKDTSGKYIWVGKVRQEFALHVADNCGNNSSPDLDSMYNFETYPGGKLEFKIRVDDPSATGQTTPDTISLLWNGAIPGATFQRLSDKVPNTETAQFTWQTKPSDGSSNPYHFTFMVNDSHCSHPASGSRAVNVQVKFLDTSGFKYFRYACNQLLLTAFAAKSGNENNTVFWTITDSAGKRILFSGVGDTVKTPILPKGNIRIGMKLKNRFYYYHEVVKTIYFDSTIILVKLPKDTSVCIRSGYQSVSQTSLAIPPIKYSWRLNGKPQPNDTISSFVLSNIDTTQLLQLTITDSNTCSAQTSQRITLFADSQVVWTKPDYRVCCLGGAILLNELTNVGDSTNSIFWCSDSGFITSTGNLKFFHPEKYDNSQLQNGVFKELKLYSTFISSHNCYSTDSSLVKIVGNPIVQLKDKKLCQDMQRIPLDSMVVVPKVKLGTIRKWILLQAPLGLDSSKVITNIAGTDYFNFGTKPDTSFAGNYSVVYKVTDQVTGCYGADTSAIEVQNKPIFAFDLPGICSDQPEISMLQHSTLNQKSVVASPNTTYRIYAWNKDPNDPKVKGTSLNNGEGFLPASGHGLWSFIFRNIGEACTVEDTFDIDVFPAPKAGFTTSPKDSAQITNPEFSANNNSSIADNSALQYFWNFGTGNPNDTSSATNPTIKFPAQEANYNVMLIGLSNKGCRDTFFMKLQIYKGMDGVNIPELRNAWIDNYFRIHGVEFRSMQSNIFDASGRLVSSFANNTGATLPAGIYYYQVKIVLANGNTAILKGSAQTQH